MRSISGSALPTFPRPARGLAIRTSGPNGLVMVGSSRWSWQQDPRIHDSLTVNGGLDPGQHVDPGFTKLGGQVGGLQPSNPVMVGEGSARGGTASRRPFPRGKIAHLRVNVVGSTDRKSTRLNSSHP